MSRLASSVHELCIDVNARMKRLNAHLDRHIASDTDMCDECFRQIEQYQRLLELLLCDGKGRVQ